MPAPTRKLAFHKPMLAKDFSHEREEFPCYIQPKVDGVRCITDGQRFWSREGNLFPKQNFEHLRTAQLPYLLDGELSMPRHSDFEDIVSIVKRAGHAKSAAICFNAFDVITDEPYTTRKARLRMMFEQHQLRIVSQHWNRLITKKVLSKSRLRAYHNQFLERGYEGSIIRTPTGLYVSKRTFDIMKWKPLMDAEFEIVDVKEAKGKDKGTPVFVCAVGRPSNGLTFRVRPKGTHKARRKMWRMRADLPGMMLTVEFQNYTKYGKPRFPRAKVLRNYE